MNAIMHNRIPHVAMTTERIAALRRAIQGLLEEQGEYKTHNYPTARDFDIEGAISQIEEMIADAESAIDNLKGHH